MLIKVTQEDIDLGKPRSYQYCPVALAVVRACNRAVEYVSVGFGVVDVYLLPREHLMARYPAEVNTFIGNFDRGATVAPFEFELPLEPKRYSVLKDE